MKAFARLAGVLLAVLFFPAACDPANTNGAAGRVTCESGSLIRFDLDVDKDIFLYTDYGEPPQLAVWLEREGPDGVEVRTVWVSHRTGKNQWKGKVICPVALPFWTARHRLERSGFKERSLLERLMDAVSGATPKGGLFRVEACVPRGSVWRYFVETNLSGDYNRAFPYRKEGGMPDPEGNGQPSIVFAGTIRAEAGETGRPVLAGRTHQLRPVEQLIRDVSGITSARRIFRSIVARCMDDPPLPGGAKT